MTSSGELTLQKKRVAIVIANPSTSIVTHSPAGFWWSQARANSPCQYIALGKAIRDTPISTAARSGRVL
ncbi:hypothetical protein ACE02Y_07065 [Shewanella xiamenensis]|jgi:hypothetical protein|uniref:Uncharacterized protein n=1 Tax=Shewanella xiamenensis TaxID=332186 RepID=A0AAE4PZB0_9GAMM|nr:MULTISPECIES: hypothetical protein [Shewanella]MDH1625655.1 hypothetical protein [Shewanella xiamenensis]MDV5245692.1 hypothetical protein [Shewanella xiamenensis]MDV5391155.1 hypothetical protein [Shewanella xiamenensis]BDQ65282.1 hypothetical protein NUITMVS2_10940 [Shewanella xiamenensis]GLD76373.1 hypothetical protein NUITMVS3_08040 [Shewanella xiamenensis]